MKFDVMEIKRKRGEWIKEIFENGTWSIVYSDEKNKRRLDIYSVEDLDKTPELNLYNGHNPKELMDSGRDILAEELLKNGEPDFEEVRKYFRIQRIWIIPFLVALQAGAVLW